MLWTHMSPVPTSVSLVGGRRDASVCAPAVPVRRPQNAEGDEGLGRGQDRPFERCEVMEGEGPEKIFLDQIDWR